MQLYAVVLPHGEEDEDLTESIKLFINKEKARAFYEQQKEELLSQHKFVPWEESGSSHFMYEIS